MVVTSTKGSASASPLKRSLSSSTANKQNFISLDEFVKPIAQRKVDVAKKAAKDAIQTQAEIDVRALIAKAQEGKGLKDGLMESLKVCQESLVTNASQLTSFARHVWNDPEILNDKECDV